MTSVSAFTAARGIALLLPVGLLAGALASQYLFGLYPCEMCHWQRWPHYAALVPGVAAFLPFGTPVRRALILLAALLVAISGAIGVFHAGVEYGWWQGLTTCTAPVATSMEDLLNAPLIRCDVAPWTLAGVSLAGFNAIFSLGGAGFVLALLFRSKGNAR
jgi:disulfide bond formation protein DsbB